MSLRPFRPVRVNIGGTRPGSAAAQQFRKIEDNFRQWTLHMTSSSGEVLRRALEPTLRLAKSYTPVKTGALRQSGYVEVRRQGLLRGYEAEIGVGRGGYPAYAIYVHEVPYRHTEPTRWKFLQVALEEDAAAIRQRLAGNFRLASGV